MGKIMLAGVCSCALCVVTQAFAVPFPFAGTTYQQDFNGLSWSKDGAGKNFGQSTSNTLGWAASTSRNYSVNGYNYRSAANMGSNSTYSGAPIMPAGATTPPDKSFTITSPTSKNCYIGVCLTNTTGQTISSADIGYTLELWTTRTGPLSGAVVEYDVGQHAFTDNMNGLWNDFAAEGIIDTFSFAAGQAPGAELVRSWTLSNLDWQPEQTLVVRWTFPSTLPNQVVGIDDFLIAVPEPSSMLMASGVILATLARRQRSRK